MDVVFCGTPQFAVPTLEKLLEAGFNIPLAVTQPDRPRGRGMEMAHSPVKVAALKHNLPIQQPERIKDNPAFREALEAVRAGAFIVVGYGRIIPEWMRNLPPLGNVNLHASLLPKYRGAAPIQWAIANGEPVTGVTTMLINEGLDTGDILLQQELPILDDDTALTLAPRLADIGADLVITTLRGLVNNDIVPRPQDNAASSLAPILAKEDGRINFSRSAHEIYNRLRGFQPWPGAFTLFRGKQLSLLKVSLISELSNSELSNSELSNSPAGEMSTRDQHLHVSCGSGTRLEILEVQLEGKKRVSAADFLRGYRLQPGEKLG